jgi:hypothetical protein
MTKYIETPMVGVEYNSLIHLLEYAEEQADLLRDVACEHGDDGRRYHEFTVILETLQAYVERSNPDFVTLPL